MPQPEGEIDIARNIRTIEWLKTELLAGVSGLFRAMLRGSEEAITDGLSGLIISCYALARRLGYSFAKLDAKVEARVRMNISEGHEIEKWYGDLTALLRYFEERKR
ncbi:MAG: MazG-like family protein [Chloroflexota bacterium]